MIHLHSRDEHVCTLPYDFPKHLLPEVCRAYEEQRNDGLAVLAWQEGQIIADAECVHNPEGYYVDAATATGIYDLL